MSMITKGLFSSNKQDWETPDKLFSGLHKEFNFKTDVCATRSNKKIANYISPTMDSLSEKVKWRGVCWMNPPYGRQIVHWIKKAYESSTRGAVVVCLLPSRTDTRWFHDYCTKGEIRFLKGRLRFKPLKDNAPFPSMIVIFKRKEGV